MHSQKTKRLSRTLTMFAAVLTLTACGQGDGPESIENSPATPLPPIPPGFCDAINFEILCPPITIINFNGGATTVIENPDMSGINTSDLVAQMQKFPDEPFGGTKLDTGEPIDFSQGETYTVKVWASRNVELTFKLDEQNKERVQNHSGSSSWEELCFDFSGDTAGVPNPGLTLIFDNGTLGQADTNPADWTFFYDDVTQVTSCGGGGTPLPDLPVDFEGGVNSWFSNFEGGDVEIVANPDKSGINMSDEVAQMRKFMGELFGGSTMGLANPVDFSNGEVFTVKVWASRQVPVLFKLEGLNQELTLNHTGSSSWEELCFDFTGLTAGAAATAITFIFDNGVMGDADNDAANWTFYFDDITQAASCGGGGPIGGTPITPDNVVFATDPGLVVDLPPPVVDNFGSGAVFDFMFAGNAEYNPALQITSGEGYGAGVHVGFVALTGYAAGFAANFENLVFKVNGDVANLTSFEVKFIEGGTDTSVLYDLTTYSGAEDLGNGWLQVSVPMTDFAATIAANAGFLLGPAGGQAGPFTLLLTDIGFTGIAGGGSGNCDPVNGEIATNGDFETGDLSCFEVFDNGGTITADNTENNGGMWSAHAVAGTGNNPVLKLERRAAGIINGSAPVTVTFDMKGSAADGGVVFPELISEGAGGATSSEILETIAAPTADWTTYSYNTTAAADVSEGLTFQLAIVCGGAATCSADVFIDNVSVQFQ